MTRFRAWWRRVVRPWVQRNRADRQMPEPIARWRPGGPVTVWLHPDLPSDYAGAMCGAVAAWRRVIGRETFYLSWMADAEVDRYATGFWPVRTAVVVPAAPERAAAATTWHELDAEGYAMRCEVRLEPGLGGERLQRYAMHELGHVLGLAHARDPELLMSPRASGVSLLPSERAWLLSQWPSAS